MQFKEEKKDNVLIFRILHPRLDSTNGPEFKTEMFRLIESEQEKGILIDLKEVDYADSSGLGALLFGLRQARAHSAQFKLVNVNPKVLNLIKIAKLDHVIEGFDDEQEAIASFD